MGSYFQDWLLNTTNKEAFRFKKKLSCLLKNKVCAPTTQPLSMPVTTLKQLQLRVDLPLK